MIGLAGAVLGRVYADSLLTQLVLGAAVGSVGVSLAARRLPSWLVAPLSVGALLGYTAFALWFTAQRADLPGALGTVAVDAARNGIPRLLTALIPVEPMPDTVIVPLVAAWLAGLAGAEVGIRASRVLLGLVAPAVLYAGALYVVGPNAEPTVWSTLAFATAGAVALAAGGRPSQPPPGPSDPGSELPPAVRATMRLRVLASTAAGLAVVVGLAVLLAPLVARQVGATPVDPRRYVQPPQVDSLDENPLIRISGWALSPDQKLLDVTTSGGTVPAGPAGGAPGGGAEPTPADGEAPVEPDPVEELEQPAGVRIRLAVLNDYDGVTWRVGATYRNAGRVLPAVESVPDLRTERIQQQITIDGLTGRLLPAVPTPREVTGARVAYDQSSGTMIRPEGLKSGLAYSVTSVREYPDYDLLPAANVPSGDAVARFLRVEAGAPEQLTRLATQLAEDNGAPYGRAAAIETFLAEHYRVVPDAPSGHAYPNLNFFLFGPSNGGGQRGTSEQFAASFAVLARMMGLPSRVVVGFQSSTGSGPVRAADALAWPEVLFDGLGWVPFNPLPKPNTKPRPVEEDFKPEPEDPTPPPDEASETAEPTPSGTPGPAAAPDRRGGLGTPVLVGGGTGGLLLLLTGLAVVVVGLRRAQRRRRLAEGSPAQRIYGAWREVTDALRLAGRPVPNHLAATEVAEHARSSIQGAAAPSTPTGPGDDVPAPADPTATTHPATLRRAVPPIDDLAVLVNLAAFAPGHATDDQARQAAELALTYAGELRADRPWWRRALWSLHPGPLRWRS
ncbi:transglutaminase domain-containing protein [Plantactinospora sp. S1510]|uniref:Transglutaminase domain-containing protein n=1 Tax=Plantactinospora alkalitolerans TaxID=2789879 RepID=A0ABS0GMV0_9ACTN|nr:transglutaminase domain-containing protein [Plantactinospora alkalitolerans]MBF9127519.1 transglutaminase domain-containing protein [Plantactinospora alkalitolerans]